MQTTTYDIFISYLTELKTDLKQNIYTFVSTGFKKFLVTLIR